MSHPQKIIILDGLDLHVPSLGPFIEDAFKDNGLEVYRFSAQRLKKKRWYYIRRFIYKGLHRFIFGKSRYCYYTKLNESCFIKLFRKIQPDFFLSLYYIYPYLRHSTLRKLKQETNCQLWLLDTDSANVLKKRSKSIFLFQKEMVLYDRILSFSQVMTHFMQGLGLQRAEFFPYGSKRILLPDLPLKKSSDICFVGTPDMRRIFYLERLKHHQMTIYGKKWSHYAPLVTPQLWSKIILQNIWNHALYTQLQTSKIILNINLSVWNTVQSGVNLRIFEALAIKGFLLTDFCEELKDLFKIGQEIETFSSPDELADKVDYYLQHDQAREKIAQHGHEKFLSTYTWTHRIRELLKSNIRL